LRLRFLGTGTSFGVPVVGCACATCTSDDVRDRRTRHAALIEDEAGTLLVDTPPELRLQLVAAGCSVVDAVWFTHSHADHVHGIDDLRVFSVRAGRPLHAFAEPVTAATLRRRFAYIFDPSHRLPEGMTRPQIELHDVEPGAVVRAAGLDIASFALPHGDLDVLGFRIGALGYVTDAKRIPDAAAAVLDGVRVLVINALWYGNPHPTHFNIEEAIAAARHLGAERIYLTHLTHRVRHRQLLDMLPAGIEPAHDGLAIDI
jgi:phosphoribosyl 1,2-cyclic phosphate phosphodiesterase